MSEHIVASEDELEPGERLVVQIKGREVAIFNQEGDYYAHLNWCTHQGGPICEGPLTGTRKACFDQETLKTTFSWGRTDSILNCPWHGWEFDIESGECLSRKGADLLTFPVSVKDGDIVVEVTVEEFNQAIENGHVSLEGNASEGISTASNDQTESKVVDIQASPSKIAGGDE
ncbi:Rieske (2Fe-2S) protein [Halostagnicola sp. A56]|uniref:Rieske (2Fe-2S) protein n=1 Tax=Halostagnicola sp. A56 TaxID=1495067 RepID=UPI0009E373C0|nr:Rieske (2Fe-2S) protein [Halostagnicola sp. A56]